MLFYSCRGRIASGEGTGCCGGSTEHTLRRGSPLRDKVTKRATTGRRRKAKRITGIVATTKAISWFLSIIILASGVHLTLQIAAHKEDIVNSVQKSNSLQPFNPLK